jgi:hypothetical protein
MAKILLSAGPIPARLDSVKFVTNRFKGGLAIKTACALADLGHEVTIVKWEHSDLGKVQEGRIFVNSKDCLKNFAVIDVEDVLDYQKKVIDFKAGVYVLAAAVANLMPSVPYSGKFPSHKYKVREKFDIQFEIAPRIIDQIKKTHPRSGLVGYKLFDGTEEQLIEAGWETLKESKANIVFANHPAWAKEKKIMLTQDGSVIPMSFDEHVLMIHKLTLAQYYKTEIILDPRNINEELQATQLYPSEVLSVILEVYPKYKVHNSIFGCFALRALGGFVTTTRGKEGTGFTYVEKVDHVDKIVFAQKKATLNAPTLSILFSRFEDFNIIIHGHQQIKDAKTFDYEFPGTYQEIESLYWVRRFGENVFNIKHHGYIAGFKTLESCLKWLSENESNR